MELELISVDGNAECRSNLLFQLTGKCIITIGKFRAWNIIFFDQFDCLLVVGIEEGDWVVIGDERSRLTDGVDDTVIVTVLAPHHSRNPRTH